MSGAWAVPDDEVDGHLDGVRLACKAGYEMLLKDENCKAIDVAERVIEIMEDNSIFDCATGSFLNAKGDIEMDALIATTDAPESLAKVAAIAAIKDVRHPINVARKLLDAQHHVLLVGTGANEFAKNVGIDTVDPASLLVGRELARFESIKAGHAEYALKSGFATTADTESCFVSPSSRRLPDTVGVVVRDRAGRMAVALSTGGVPFKLAGRVGDTPLWGCGGYIDKETGAAATGYGEDLIRVLMSRSAVDFSLQTGDPHKAAKLAMSFLSTKTGGLGGIIIMNKDSVGINFNTPRMPFAFQFSNKDMVSGINPKDIEMSNNVYK